MGWGLWTRGALLYPVAVVQRPGEVSVAANVIMQRVIAPSELGATNILL